MINLPPELTTHQLRMSISIFTKKFVSQLISISAYLDVHLQSERWCPLCGGRHTMPKICFSAEDDDITQLKLLLDILDNTLYFDWTDDGHQELIFHYVIISLRTRTIAFHYSVAHSDMITLFSMNGIHTCLLFSSRRKSTTMSLHHTY